MEKKTLVSGIKPTGIPQIGNYLGAIKPWVDLQSKYKMILFVADAHAITVPISPENLKTQTLQTAALLIACGIDPARTILFIQSHVPAHFEMAWILNTLTPVGDLERMTQYKEKREEVGVLAGLLNYPILQAADILLYQPDIVPVGEDQLQHLEFTRTLARKFNARWGEFFKKPEALVQKETARIMGLDNPKKKMSKTAASAGNYISLLDTPKDVRKKIQSAITDSDATVRHDPEKKIGLSNLMLIYREFSGLSFTQIEARYKGKGYEEFKDDLAELLVDRLTPIQKEYETLMKNKKTLLSHLESGASRASEIADKTLTEAKEKVGFIL